MKANLFVLLLVAMVSCSWSDWNNNHANDSPSFTETLPATPGPFFIIERYPYDNSGALHLRATQYTYDLSFQMPGGPKVGIVRYQCAPRSNLMKIGNTNKYRCQRDEDLWDSSYSDECRPTTTELHSSGSNYIDTDTSVDTCYGGSGLEDISVTTTLHALRDNENW